MKLTRWEETLFNVLVNPIKKTDERKIESKLNYYYQILDTQDLVACRIGDVESNFAQEVSYTHFSYLITSSLKAHFPPTGGNDFISTHWHITVYFNPLFRHV